MKRQLIECHDLAAGYGREPAIERVDFQAGEGERIAVLGPNGGGKTTLFRVLAGELAPLSGTVRADPSCGWVAQGEHGRLDFPVSALDVATMGALARLPWWRPPGRVARARARRALARVGLEAQADERFGELSGGQRRRVAIARALVQEARVLLLDEPFSGLDARSGEELMALIDELAAAGHVVLVATHDLDQARAWDAVLCLNGRQIAFGPPATALTRPVLEATYGGDIVEIPGTRAAGVLPPHHHHHHDASDGEDLA